MGSTDCLDNKHKMCHIEQFKERGHYKRLLVKCSRPNLRLVTLFLSLNDKKNLNQRSFMTLRLYKGRNKLISIHFLKMKYVKNWIL